MAINKKVNLNFHQTFPPDAAHISALLSLAESQEAYTKEDISDITGIPTGKSSGKVEPAIKYAEYMGLVEDEYKDKRHLLRLTPLGKEILYQDEMLQEKATLYLCHSGLVSDSGASLWNCIFSMLIPRYGSLIKMVTLKDALRNYYNGADVNLAPVNSSYTGMFKKLSVLKNGQDEIKFTYQTFKDAYYYIYVYMFLKEWEIMHPDAQELTAGDVYSMNVDYKLCLTRADFDKVLTIMDSEGIIKIERLLNPFVVLKLHTSEEIIKKIYSRI